MPRYKHIDTSPRFLAVDLERQLLPGSLAWAINHLLDHDFDLSAFDARYDNDKVGAPALPPGMLLKVILCAYAEGVVSSRGIERLCREHVTFIALSGDTAPHFTTLAGFVASLGDDASRLFAQVLYLCDQQGLIGRQMFAIDGVKLPSNASKHKSGTRADFERQAGKLEEAARKMIARHRSEDAHDSKTSASSAAPEATLDAKATERLARLRKDAAALRTWLADNPEERKGSRGSVRLSNRTDNESAKMATSKGVIQGYCGVAAVDAAHQIIIDAQAHGTGSEQELLIDTIAATQPYNTPDTLYTADAGYHSEANLKALHAAGIPALIADNGMRGRDERFKDQAQHKAKPDPLHDKSGKAGQTSQTRAGKCYRPADFEYDSEAGTCICPAGKALYANGKHCQINGRLFTKFSGTLRDCGPCAQRDKCLRSPDKTKVRQVAFYRGKADTGEESFTERMRRAIDSEEGRRLYGQRFATVEPVFGNIRHNKQLNRFTLRGQKKVDVQWKLYCLVHNIEKLAHHGYGQ